MVTPLLWVLVFKSATVNPRWNNILKRNSRQIIHKWEMFQPTMLNYHRIIEPERFGKGWQSTCRIQAAIFSWKLGDLVVTIPWWASTVAPFRTVPKSTQLSLARLPIYGWRHHILLVFHVSLFMISPCRHVICTDRHNSIILDYPLYLVLTCSLLPNCKPASHLPASSGYSVLCMSPCKGWVISAGGATNIETQTTPENEAVLLETWNINLMAYVGIIFNYPDFVGWFYPIKIWRYHQ
jgi:hypothetical protein